MEGTNVRVLIAGCGYVGTALAGELAAAGHEVYALRRSGAPLPLLVQTLTADLTQPASLQALPTDLAAVFYLAAPGQRSDAAYRATYVAGLSNLLRVLEARDPLPRQIIFASSTRVYAQNTGEWVDEASPAEPLDFAGRCLLEAETCLRASGLQGISIRFAGIYGPGRTRFLENVRSGCFVCDPAVRRVTNRIHRDDCAGVLQHILRLPQPQPLYLGTDCEPVEEGEVACWLAERLGVAPPPLPSPTRPLANKRCSNRRLLESGYRFRFPTFREGYGTS